MDLENLQTASHYVNNLLLSRGLLRNGKPIDFAKPSKGEGGADATMAKIINLVHDLILRRDRETETMTSLSQTISTVRTVSAQQSQAVSRLEGKKSDLERQVALCMAQDRTARASLKSAEIRNKALREDMSRLKATVLQIRTQCATDVRKRDMELKRLQKHLEVRRGREGSAQPGVTVVIPGITKPKGTGNRSTGGKIESPTYSLKEETTEFLTQLSQSLSDENDSLISLAQMTLATLRSLQGLPERPDSMFGQDELTTEDLNVAVIAPPSYEKLAMEMDEVLEHLRSLLTNPSFVPLEEVELREEEIVRLRDGWDRMESRWREALSLMNGWRKRMMETGDTINLEDLRKGLDLAGEDAMRKSTRDLGAFGQKQDASEESLLSQESIDFAELAVEAELAADQVSPVKRDLGVGLFPAPSILQTTNGNARKSLSPRKISFRANSPRIGALLDSLGDSDDIALVEYAAEGNIFELGMKSNSLSDPSEPELSVQQKLEKARNDAERAAEARRIVESKKPVKRTAIPRKARAKRRSTLSPEELEGLMGI